MGEGFLVCPDPRKLSVQERNLLKIRSLQKERKDSLEVQPCELTGSCLGVEQCVITCPAFRVCCTLPKTISQTHLVCWGKLCPTSQPSPATAAPNSLARLLTLGQVCIPHPKYRHPLMPPASLGLWAAPFEQNNGESESRIMGNQPRPPEFLSRQTLFRCCQAARRLHL